MGATILEEKGITFDDVLIVPAYSSVDPSKPNVRSFLSKNIELNLPFIGSPMDDVSGPRFCIAMAQHGAISFLHRNYTLEEQVNAVLEVKKHEGYVLSEPITVTPEMRIGDVLKLKSERGLKFGSFPVVDEHNKVIGILTDTDYYLEHPNSMVKTRMSTDVAKILKADSEDRDKVREILRATKTKRLVVVDKNDKLKGLITGKDFMLREQYSRATRDANGRLRVGAAIGVGEKEIERACKLYDAGADTILIDVSHGDCKNEVDTIKTLRKIYGSDMIIGGGNVATAGGVENLVGAEVDYVRIGLGSSRICTTRKVIGAGVPQVTAILNCSEAAHKHGIYAIADGGINEYGDIAKALASGADTVMMGGLFAGVDEAPGRKVLVNGRMYKVYRGMGSKQSMLNRAGGGLSRYGEQENKRVIPQGVEGIVDYKGNLDDVLYQMEGALKHSFAIVGASQIDEFRKKAVLMKVSNNGALESRPYVTMTEQPENYMGK